MTRISSYDLNIRPNGEVNSAITSSQVQLDAALNSFSSQATDTTSLASMTFVGLVGKLARMGILSTFGRAQQAAPLQLLSHLGSVSAEAVTMTSISRGGSLWPPALDGQTHGSAPTQEFLNHFINFGIFRLMGGVGGASGAPTQHLIQSLAMMAGHQATTFVGLETDAVNGAPSKSLAEQFLEANLATLQISVGSTLASRLNGGRLERMERVLEERISTSLLKNISHPTNEQSLIFSASDMPTPPQGITEPLSRIAPIYDPELPIEKSALLNVQATLERQIGEFQSTTDLVSSFLSSRFLAIVRSFHENNNGRHLLDMHGRLCGGTKGVLGSVDRKGRTDVIPNLERMLVERLSFFASHIIALEKSAQADFSKTQKMREQLYTAYDQLQLIRESLKLAMRFSPVEETPYYQGIGKAYVGLRRSSRDQAERVRNFTQSTIIQIDDKAVELWADTFVSTCDYPRAALNAQIIRGRVNIFRGEIIRGNFYDALKDCPTGPIKTVRILFDPESGQIVDFYDHRGQAEASRLAFQARKIYLQEALIYVDPIEAGEITHVQVPRNTPSEVRNALTKLVGFQVLASSRVFAYEDRENPSDTTWTISLAWQICEDPSQIYRLSHVSPQAFKWGPEDNQTEWHLFTLDSITSAGEGVQLWVPKNSFQTDQLTQLVKLVKRSVKVDNNT